MAAIAAEICLDIVQLRDDMNAVVEWLDSGFCSTTAWKRFDGCAIQQARKAERGERSNRRRRVHAARRQSKASQEGEVEVLRSICTEASAVNSFPRRRHAKGRRATMVSIAPFDDASLRGTEDDETKSCGVSVGSFSRDIQARRGKPSLRRGSRVSTCSEYLALTVAGKCSDTASAESDPCLGGECVSDVETCASREALCIDAEAADETSCSATEGSKRGTSRCKHCHASYSGFGDTCSACRKAGPRGSIKQCNLCSHFFTGFGGTCHDCCV